MIFVADRLRVHTTLVPSTAVQIGTVPLRSKKWSRAIWECTIFANYEQHEKEQGSRKLSAFIFGLSAAGLLSMYGFLMDTRR